MKTDLLLRLVRSLTKAEKRYFKLSASRNLKTKVGKHILLFDFINDVKGKEVNYKSFQQKQKVKNISALKETLQESLLNALREFKAKNDTSFQIANEIGEIRVLMERNIFSLAKQKIGKALIKCKEEEDIALQFELLRHQSAIIFTEDEFISDTRASINNLDEMLKLSSFFEIYASLMYVQNTIAFIINHPSENPDKYLDKVEKILFQDKLKEVLNFNYYKYKLMYYSCISHFYRMKYDSDSSFSNQQSAYELVKKRFAEKGFLDMVSLPVIFNYFGSCVIYEKKVILAKEYHWFSKNIKPYSKREESLYFRMLYEYYFKISNITDYLPYDEAYFTSFEEAMENSPIEKGGQGEAMLYLEVIQYLFKYKNYSKSIRYIYSFMGMPVENVYGKIFISVDAMRMLCYANLGDFDVLKNEYKYFKKKYAETDFPLFYKAMCEFLETTIGNPTDVSSHKKILYTRLVELKEIPEYAMCFYVFILTPNM